MKSTTCSLLLTLLLGALAHAGPKTFPTTIECYDPNTGWGLGPGAIGVTCRANLAGNSVLAAKYYENYALDGNDFLDPVTSADQLRTYEDNILDLLEQIATDFYRERAILEKRHVSPEELKGWINAVLAVAFQESYHSHYQFDRRTGDKANRLNVLVGDAKCAVPYARRDDGRYYCPQFKVNADGMRIYASQGMFQINMAVHSANSKNGFFDMVQNIQYGMAFYYSIWVKIIQKRHSNMASCRDVVFPNGVVDYVKAAQAGYSVYNGGASSVLADGPSPWSRNDDGYRNAVENKIWYRFSSDEAARDQRKQDVTLPNGQMVRRFLFPFDLQCVRSARSDCMP